MIELSKLVGEKLHLIIEVEGCDQEHQWSINQVTVKRMLSRWLVVE